VLTNDIQLWWAKAHSEPNPLLKTCETDNSSFGKSMVYYYESVKV